MSFLLLPSCNQEGPDANAAQPPLRVLATTTMVGDMVRRVAGDSESVHITTLMGPGVDPHLYKPTASDITALQNADVIFYNGLHLEGRMGELMHRLEDSGKIVAAVTSNIPPEQLLGLTSRVTDPHVWGDASIWSQCVPVVAKTLIAANPRFTEEYQKQADALQEEYATLHEWVGTRIATISAKHRMLITSHDAFAYFGRAYGLEVLAVQGLSTATEAGLADMAAISDVIRATGIKAVFIESSVSPATIERISGDTGAKIGGELFSDALGTPGDMETADGETYDKGTYAGMLKHNVNTVVGALTE